MSIVENGNYVVSNFRKALIFTAIPIVILSLVSLGGRSTDFTEGLGIAWLVAGGLWIIAVLTAISFAIIRRREIASGMLVGVAIGLAKTPDQNWFQIVEITGKRVWPRSEIYLGSLELQEEMRRNLNAICNVYGLKWESDPPDQKRIEIY